MLRIGLTGGIASGKSAASDYFASLGIPVIDTDLISRELVQPGTRGLQRIVDTFGEAVIDDKDAQILLNIQRGRTALFVLIQ